MFVRLVIYGLVIAGGAYIGTAATDNVVPVSVIRAVPENSVVPPGGFLRIVTTVQRWRSCPVKIERIIFDAEKGRWPMEDLDFKTAPGRMGEDEYRSEIKLPDRAAYGPARYVVINSWTCNWLQRFFDTPITSMSPDVHFVIAGPPLPIPIPGAR